jgi:hypothetical protein
MRSKYLLLTSHKLIEIDENKMTVIFVKVAT